MIINTIIPAIKKRGSHFTFIKFTVIVSGMANPFIVDEPDVSKLNDSFKIISTNKMPREQITDYGYEFTKTYDYLLQPQVVGVIDVPSIHYASFSVKEDKYKIDKTKPIKIEVLETAISLDTNAIEESYSSNSINEIRAKLNPIKTSQHLRSYDAYIITNPNLVMVIVIYIMFMMLLVPVSVVLYKHRKRLVTDTEFARNSMAYKKAKLKLKRKPRRLPKPRQLLRKNQLPLSQKVKLLKRPNQ